MSADSNKLAVTLDTLRFPLHGARLIEASAGTGKPIPSQGCICVWCLDMAARKLATRIH